MSPVIREPAAVYVLGAPKPRNQTVDRPDLSTSFFEFRVNLSSHDERANHEMSDRDLLRAAESSGTFRFLDDPEEDIYRP